MDVKCISNSGFTDKNQKNTMNQEIKDRFEITEEFANNLIQMLHSDEANINLAFQIAPSYCNEYIKQFQEIIETSLTYKDISKINKEVYTALVSRDRISFYSKCLTALPVSLFKLTSLKRLSLYKNQLNSIPGDILKLRNLEYISLCFNSLSTLPEEISNLYKLEELNLEGNKLTSIPDSIYSLKNLGFLGLENNKITSIPERIRELKNLDVLILRCNPIPKKEIDKIKEVLPNCRVFF